MSNCYRIEALSYKMYRSKKNSEMRFFNTCLEVWTGLVSVIFIDCIRSIGRQPVLLVNVVITVLAGFLLISAEEFVFFLICRFFIGYGMFSVYAASSTIGRRALPSSKLYLCHELMQHPRTGVNACPRDTCPSCDSRNRLGYGSLYRILSFTLRLREIDTSFNGLYTVVVFEKWGN